MVAADRQSVRRACLRPGDPAGHGCRRLSRRPERSQTYELEADTLGAFITARAGYDPERGAADLSAPGAGRRRRAAAALEPSRVGPPPGHGRRRAADIRRQRALGLTPRPGQTRLRPIRLPIWMPYGFHTHSIRRKNRCALHFRVCETLLPPLDTPTPQRTGPVGSRRGGKPSERDAGRVQVKTQSAHVVRKLLKFMNDEGICGRFGSFRWTYVCISVPLGFGR